MDEMTQADVAKLATLTPHQLFVLQTVCQTSSYAEAAVHIGIKLSTLQDHMDRISVKLGIDDLDKVPRQRAFGRFNALVPLLEQQRGNTTGEKPMKRRQRGSAKSQLPENDIIQTYVAPESGESTIERTSDQGLASTNTVPYERSATLVPIVVTESETTVEASASESEQDDTSDLVVVSRSETLDGNLRFRRFVTQFGLALACIALVLLVFQRFRDDAFMFLLAEPPEAMPDQTCIMIVDPVPGQDVRVPLDAATGQKMATGLQVQANDLVTTSFTITNRCTETITLGQLRAGGRMYRSCANLNEDKWDSNVIVEFDAVRDVTLDPGQSYTYQQSRAFSEPGMYFVEPLKQGGSKPWGGFSPSICSDLEVVQR